MNKLLLSTLLIFGFIFNGICQMSQSFEITTIDIIKEPLITSRDISVFNITIGMSQTKVQDLLKQNEQIYHYVDDMHMTDDFRIYVYNKEENNCILYLIWEFNGDALTKITFFEDFEPYLIGQSKKLYSTDFLDKDSYISTNFFGKYDRSQISLNIPSIQMKHVTYFFDSKGIKLTIKKNREKETVVFSFYEHK